MPELLDQLETSNIAWGVVTNKPAFLTNPLMEELNLHRRAKTIISGDTTANKKPHPEPIYLACRQAGVEPSQAIYVGDAQRDIQAGNAAGLITLAALFGYLDENDKPELWNATALIEHPSEVGYFVLTA
jgi:phosphoglycolate phosphatase